MEPNRITMEKHPITAELEKLGIPTFGSIDQQKQRYERLTRKNIDQEDIMTYIATLIEQYRWAVRFECEDVNEIYAEIVYYIHQI
jgi:hypothetical protein